jgi:hypothetical protein
MPIWGRANYETWWRTCQANESLHKWCSSLQTITGAPRISWKKPTKPIHSRDRALQCQLSSSSAFSSASSDFRSSSATLLRITVGNFGHQWWRKVRRIVVYAQLYLESPIRGQLNWSYLPTFILGGRDGDIAPIELRYRQYAITSLTN